MDASTLARLLMRLLPADLAAYVNKHALSPDAPLQIYLSQARIQASRAAERAYPYVQPGVERLASAVSSDGAVGSLLVPVAILAVAVIALNWIRRLVVWWTRMAVRAVFWACVVALGAWVWNRGIESCVRDVVVAGGTIAGYLAVVKDIWIQEYNRYEGQQKGAAQKVMGKGRGR